MLKMLLVIIAMPALMEAQTTIDARTAQRMVDGCVTLARSKGQSHAIAIYDTGGHSIALLRMDGNAPGITDFAMQKAEAVARWQFSTAQMESAVKSTPGFANAPHVVTVPGGVPVYSADGRQFIGAVGVSGEAAADDVACAEAAVKAGGFSLSRRR